MTSQILLILCFVFIFYLIFLAEYKQYPKVSRSLWIPLIWVMIIGSRFVSQWLNPARSPVDAAEGSPLDRNIFLSLIILGIFILFKRKIDWRFLLKNNIWLFCFLYYISISILWSDWPFISFKRWIKEIGNIVMVLIILTDQQQIEAIKTVVKKCSYILIPLSIVLIKYFPIYGRSYSPSGSQFYGGVTVYKNALGILCLICGLFIVWDLYIIWMKRKTTINKCEFIINILILFMTLWLFVKSDSATSLGALLIGLSIIIWLILLKNNIRFFGITLFHVIFLLTIFQTTGVMDYFIKIMGRDTTLTGRTDLWSAVLSFKLNSIIGAGYESFWLGDRAEKIQSMGNLYWIPNQSHNGYLETYLNLGVIGLLLLILFIVSVYKHCRNNLLSNFNFGIIRMSFLIITLIYNITEAAFKGLHLVWFVFLLIAIEYQPKSLISNLSLKK